MLRVKTSLTQKKVQQSDHETLKVTLSNSATGRCGQSIKIELPAAHASVQSAYVLLGTSTSGERLAHFFLGGGGGGLLATFGICGYAPAWQQNRRRTVFFSRCSSNLRTVFCNVVPPKNVDPGRQPEEQGFDHCPGKERSMRSRASRDHRANATKRKTNTKAFEFLLPVVSRLDADLQATSNWKLPEDQAVK